MIYYDAHEGHGQLPPHVDGLRIPPRALALDPVLRGERRASRAYNPKPEGNDALYAPGNASRGGEVVVVEEDEESEDEG